MIPEVHLTEDDKAICRSTTDRRANPLGEEGRPNFRIQKTIGSQELHRVIEWLDVENSPRYRPGKFTYCNVYAYDYCYLLGVYLPRVWWSESSIYSIHRGQVPSVIWADTVIELSANGLFEWLLKLGGSFGWVEIESVSDVQKKANAGNVAIIVSRNTEASVPGHISVVVPEMEGLIAEVDSHGNVISPLQSQSGRVNQKYGHGRPRWWAEAQYSDTKFWYNERELIERGYCG